MRVVVFGDEPIHLFFFLPTPQRIVIQLDFSGKFFCGLVVVFAEVVPFGVEFAEVEVDGGDGAEGGGGDGFGAGVALGFEG